MAKDLRLIFSAIRIVNDLERVGDHAVNIAQSAERLIDYPHIVPEPEIVEMARLARQMLADALSAFVRGDAPLAREVCRRDDAVDALNDSVFRILLTHMMEDPRAHRRRDGAAAGEPEPRAGGRPRHQRRRRRSIPRRRQDHQAPRRGRAAPDREPAP